MNFVGQMLAHTPLYVFALLLYLGWQGVQALRPRHRPIWRLLIVPAAFTAAGLLLLVLRPSSGVLPMVAWLGGLVAVVPLGFMTGPRILAIDRENRRATLAGSLVPLLRNLVVFSSQYAIAVATVLHPQERAGLVVVGHLVSGTTIGYFVGWTVALRRRYPAAAGGATPGEARLRTC